MRRVFYLLALVMPGAIGCIRLNPSLASTGWKFEVDRPSVISTPTLIQQTPGGLSALPLGSQGGQLQTLPSPRDAGGQCLGDQGRGFSPGGQCLGGQSLGSMAFCQPPSYMIQAVNPSALCPPGSFLMPRAEAAPGSCALEDLSRQLDRMDRRLGALELRMPPRAETLKMPQERSDR